MFRDKIITIEIKLICGRNCSYKLKYTHTHTYVNLNSTESDVYGTATFYIVQALVTTITELH
jgi:hypothetical protein